MSKYLAVCRLNGWEIGDLSLDSLVEDIPHFREPTYPVLLTDARWTVDPNTVHRFCAKLIERGFSQVIICGEALDAIHESIHETLAYAYAISNRIPELYTVILRDTAMREIVWHTLNTYAPMDGDQAIDVFVIFIHLTDVAITNQVKASVCEIAAE